MFDCRSTSSLCAKSRGDPAASPSLHLKTLPRCASCPPRYARPDAEIRLVSALNPSINRPSGSVSYGDATPRPAAISKRNESVIATTRIFDVPYAQRLELPACAVLRRHGELLTTQNSGILAAGVASPAKMHGLPVSRCAKTRIASRCDRSVRSINSRVVIHCRIQFHFGGKSRKLPGCAGVVKKSCAKCVPLFSSRTESSNWAETPSLS